MTPAFDLDVKQDHQFQVSLIAPASVPEAAPAERHEGNWRGFRSNVELFLGIDNPRGFSA
jgi:hypothetical protein